MKKLSTTSPFTKSLNCVTIRNYTKVKIRNSNVSTADKMDSSSKRLLRSLEKFTRLIIDIIIFEVQHTQTQNQKLFVTELLLTVANQQVMIKTESNDAFM